MNKIITIILATMAICTFAACKDMETVAEQRLSENIGGDSDTSALQPIETDTTVPQPTDTDTTVPQQTDTDTTVQAPPIVNHCGGNTGAFTICGARTVPGYVADTFFHNRIPIAPISSETFVVNLNMPSQPTSSIVSLPTDRNANAVLGTKQLGGVKLEILPMENNTAVYSYRTGLDSDSVYIIELVSVLGDAPLPIWQHTIPARLVDENGRLETSIATSLSHDNNQIVVVGMFTGSHQFGTESNNIELTTPNGTASNYMVKYSLDGELVTAVLLDAQIYPESLAAKPDGTYLLTGACWRHWDTWEHYSLHAVISDTNEIVWKTDPLEYTYPMLDSPFISHVRSDGSFFTMGAYWEKFYLRDAFGKGILLGGSDDIPNFASETTFVAFYDAGGALQWASNLVHDPSNYAMIYSTAALLKNDLLIVAGNTNGTVPVNTGAQASSLPPNSPFLGAYRSTGELVNLGCLPAGLTIYSSGETISDEIDMSILAVYENDLQFNQPVATPNGDVTLFPKTADSNVVILDICDIAAE